jgi:HK97 family phage prohead protease
MDKEMRVLQAAGLEIRAASDTEPQKIVGYAVLWDQPSVPIWGMFTEKFARDAFTNHMSDVYASWCHEDDVILGRTPSTLVLTQDERGLKYEITPPTWASDQIETIERGDVRGSSFIFRTVREEWDESDPKMPVRTVLEAELLEVSPVVKPAYPQTSVGMRSEQDVLNTFNEQFRSKDSGKAKMELRRRKLDLIQRS